MAACLRQTLRPEPPPRAEELSLPEDLITRLVIVSVAMRNEGLVLPCRAGVPGQGDQALGVALPKELVEMGCLASRELTSVSGGVSAGPSRVCR